MNTSRFTFILAAGIFVEDIITIICGSCQRNVWFMFWFEETFEFCWNHLDNFGLKMVTLAQPLVQNLIKRFSALIFLNIMRFYLEGLQPASV